MKASELRIGNSVLDNVGLPLTMSAVYFGDTSWIKPIPLTEEWLLKFGWIKDKTDDGTYFNGDFEIYLPNYLKYKDAILKKCKHVHQLQNLYFALTNEELTIK